MTTKAEVKRAMAEARRRLDTCPDTHLCLPRATLELLVEAAECAKYRSTSAWPDDLTRFLDPTPR